MFVFLTAAIDCSPTFSFRYPSLYHLESPIHQDITHPSHLSTQSTPSLLCAHPLHVHMRSRSTHTHRHSVSQTQINGVARSARGAVHSDRQLDLPADRGLGPGQAGYLAGRAGALFNASSNMAPTNTHTFAHTNVCTQTHTYLDTDPITHTHTYTQHTHPYPHPYPHMITPLPRPLLPPFPPPPPL
jgi:hypothetical protein